jgi:hypothetical protein
MQENAPLRLHTFTKNADSYVGLPQNVVGGISAISDRAPRVDKYDWVKPYPMISFTPARVNHPFRILSHGKNGREQGSGDVVVRSENGRSMIALLGPD